MSRAELKAWAKEKIKGHIWDLIVPIIIAAVLSSLTIGGSITYNDGQLETKSGISVGLLFTFVQVGFAYFMIKFVNDKDHSLRDLFSFAKDFVRDFLVGLLQTVFIALWGLLLIVPGVIKSIAYSMVNIILADEKYNDLGFMEVLKKSEDMMQGHKMDYFLLELSFIGWHLLAVFTLGLLEIWIMPYYNTACFKFLNDIKTEYEKANKA